MAEYGEVIKEFKRMCWKYRRELKCDDCPMYPSCNIGQCRKIAFERPAEFEQRVMKWAKEHPEPVYPTWIEWFQRQVWKKGTDASSMFLYDPIPADIAQKLGIQPKEGV